MKKLLFIDSNKNLFNLYSSQYRDLVFTDYSEIKKYFNTNNTCSIPQDTNLIIICIDNIEEFHSLFYYLRTKLKTMAHLVFISTHSLNYWIKSNPENIILASPATTLISHLSKDIYDRLDKFSSLADLSLLKPYLKPKVDKILEQDRHHLANMTAMNYMLNVLSQVYDENIDDIISQTSNLKPEFNLNQIDSAIFNSYYSVANSITLNDEKKELFKSLNHSNKKILLIDDLAENGWSEIISKMIYGIVKSPNLKALTTSDYDTIVANVKDFHPHILLLDLRLSNQKGKIKINDLEGLKILNRLQKDRELKGLPVIMFTATSNPFIVKKLLNTGAIAVWTKPGEDIEANDRFSLTHYYDLFNIIYDRFNILNYKKLNDSNKSTSQKFDDIRKIFGYIIYRSKFEQNIPFQDSTDIYIDTNFFIFGKMENFGETICNLYKLIQLSNSVEFEYKIDNNQKINISVPKIIVLNSVFNELSKHSVQNNDNLFRKAVFSFEFLRKMTGNLLKHDKIRTEFNSFNPVTNELSYCPRHISDYICIGDKIHFELHADNAIINEISNSYIQHNKLLLHNNFYKVRKSSEKGKTTNKSEICFKKNIQVSHRNRKILVLTNDKSKPDSIHNRIENLKTINPSWDVECKDINDFNKEMNKIDL